MGLIFPHQLHRKWLELDCDYYVLIEDSLFFGDHSYYIPFHKQKLLFHRLTMKNFHLELQKSNKKTIYIEYQNFKDLKSVAEELRKRNFGRFVTFDPTDYILEKRIRRFFGPDVIFLDNPCFVLSRKDLENYWQKNSARRLIMRDFYIDGRKKFQILTINGKPFGGKWSFDVENRKKLPKSVRVPEHPLFDIEHQIFYEAKEYVERNFGKNPGSSNNLLFPVTREGALELINFFVKKKLNFFGPYQDAISCRDLFLFHSGISPVLNIGLLDPNEVIKVVLSELNETNLASVEAFVRQVLGWREFMRLAYVILGNTLRKSNIFQHRFRLSDKLLFDCPPVDDCIRKAEKWGFLHHIERLMILGNFFFLCEVHPDSVYKWFMKYTLDAYDWVMVPNVYGMSQFACGDLISTKPYFSSSNYILKMSDYKRAEWSTIWDGLYYRFLVKNSEILSKNPRLRPFITRQVGSEKAFALAKIGEKSLQSLVNKGVLIDTNE
ncbi:MAG: cryptochrome/photolyase family protein [Deltaproteobacteria bacterium]|nr:cryptochrome/photolyase family protein [Deltaproteobacteria bacterium]